MTSGAREPAPLVRIVNICEKERDQGGSVRDSAEITGNILLFLPLTSKDQRNITIKTAYLSKLARTYLVC